MIGISVFTATYNRGHLLQNLYNSLLKQTYENFEWVVVDDGSEDDTESKVAEFIQDNKIQIKYVKKPNGGKHSAWNLGVKSACGELMFGCDSDDTLKPNALELTWNYWSTVRGDKTYAGVIGLRGGVNDEVLHGKRNSTPPKQIKWLEEQEYVDATIFEYRYKMKINGDRAEAIRRDVWQKFPFPVYEGENFMSESVLFDRLGKAGYKFRYFNTIIMTTNYLSDGLASNMIKNQRKSALSTAYTINLHVSCTELPLSERMRSACNYYRYGACKKTLRKLFLESNNKFFAVIAIPIGVLLKRRDDKRF
ncbi:MAG: glycosyltransferase family 2 protein [Lachnospiraceae bacterium]|nr:glycosyltransferase family 2 protein [Lachnospiraceae bacterium]